MKRPACSGVYGYWKCQGQRGPERGGSIAKILAVDDSASMRGMVAFTLRGAGHEVAEAENGQLALDIARGSSFDLVLADVNMPVMDGIAMVRELRTLDAYKGVPILMLPTQRSDERRDGEDGGRRCR